MYRKIIEFIELKLAALISLAGASQFRWVEFAGPLTQGRPEAASWLHRPCRGSLEKATPLPHSTFTNSLLPAFTCIALDSYRVFYFYEQRLQRLSVSPLNVSRLHVNVPAGNLDLLANLFFRRSSIAGLRGHAFVVALPWFRINGCIDVKQPSCRQIFGELSCHIQEKAWGNLGG